MKEEKALVKTDGYSLNIEFKEDANLKLLLKEIAEQKVVHLIPLR